MILYFLPMILFLGIITSYEDIKEGKIRNKWVIIALLYSLFANLGLIAYYYYTNSVEYSYITDILLNFGITLVISFIAWNYKVWSAGDAKLFIAYSALLPLSIYSNGYIKYFPSIVILINTFVPFAMLLLLKLILKTTMKEKWEAARSIKLKGVGLTALGLFSIQWIISYVSQYLSLSGIFAQLILSFAAYYVLLKSIKGSLFVYIALPVAIARVFFDEAVWAPIFWYLFVPLVVVLGLLSEATGLTSLFSKKVNINMLSKGMILSEGVKREGDAYKKLKGLKGSLIGLEQDGLTSREIAWLQNHKKELSFTTIKIQETLPFAPIMFTGVIFTLIMEGNLIIWIARFIMS